MAATPCKAGCVVAAAPCKAGCVVAAALRETGCVVAAALRDAVLATEPTYKLREFDLLEQRQLRRG